MTGSLGTLRHRLIVEPIYSGQKYGSLYIPDSAQENRPVLGDVISAGSEVPYEIGCRVVLRPVVGFPFRRDNRDVIVINLDDVVGHIVGTDFFPKDGHVAIVPDWRQKYRQPSSIIYLPPPALEDGSPAFFGIVSRVGKECTTLRVGDYVVMPNSGVEFGLIDTLYYILPEKDILATIQ